VRVLVKDDFGIEITVAAGTRAGEEIHLHAARRAIGRGREVGVVEAIAVLSVSLNRIAANSTVAEIIALEIAGSFGEAELVEFVVIPIADIEELDDGRG
jgi:hypothetical protein